MIGERLLLLRKQLNLSQDDFGARIGVVRSSISSLEGGRRNPSDQTILSICREFHVNEQWLRSGEGEMFSPDATDLIDEMSKQYNLRTLEVIFLEMYLKLPDAQRNAVLSFIQGVLHKVAKEEADGVNVLEYDFPKHIDLSSAIGQIDIEKEVADYRRQLELEQREKRLPASPDAKGRKNA